MPKSLVNGIGVNDLNYAARKYEKVDGRRKQVWVCPFYRAWRDMMKRCYSSKFHETRPTYVDCSVTKEWHSASRFKSWMEKQDWEGMQLDKDILMKGNKVYSPETCVFVHQAVNLFLLDRSGDRGDLPIGVSFHKKSGSYMANCSNSFTKKSEYLGCFDCPQEAHKAWKSRKRELAIQLSESEFVTDERVAKALINRYRG